MYFARKVETCKSSSSLKEIQENSLGVQILQTSEHPTNSSRDIWMVFRKAVCQYFENFLAIFVSFS